MELPLNTTQQQAIMNMSPSQSESSAVTRETSRATERGLPPWAWPPGEECPVFSFDVSGTFLSARPLSPPKLGSLFFWFLSSCQTF